jgi:arginine repressor
MSEKKEAVKKGVNKSEEIRKIATAMKAKNEKPRPIVIIDMLKKQGVAVTSPQVSQVLKGMGFRRRKRAKAGAVKNAKAAVAKAGGVRVTVEDLVTAKRVVGQFGSPEKAIRAIEALKQFS